MLRRAAAVGLIAAGAASVAAPPTSRPPSSRPQPGSGPEPLPPSPDILYRLVQRLTYGFTPEEYALAQSLGFQGYLDYHLNYTAIDDSACNARLSSLTSLTLLPYQMFDLADSSVPVTQVSEAALIRATYSKRQFFERMVEFWTDHFNIDIGKSGFLKAIDDRDVIRANALGNFGTLCRASGQSAAMLFYLDNSSSRGNGTNIPNQNYARELMELHTMGVDGGYTQSDVLNAARCLTGWTYYSSLADGNNRGLFKYQASFHDNNAKVVLGTNIPANGGLQDGITVFNLVIAHPSTAIYIAKKLAAFLLDYNPPQAVIDAAAAAFTSSNGDIPTVIRSIMTPANLSAAPNKLRRPYHLFIAGLRGLNANVTSFSTIRTNQLVVAGQVPFTWSTPDGFPDSIEYWVGNILPRWNFGFRIAQTGSLGISGVSIDLTALANGQTTAAGLAGQMNSRIYNGNLSAARVTALTNYLLPNTPTTAKIRDAWGLALSLPDFQWF